MTDLLDHGYVKLIEHWGSDERIIEAARMSTDKGFQGWGPGLTCPECKAVVVEDHDFGVSYTCPVHGVVASPGPEGPGDEKLLKFLWHNKHATPFEMAGAIFEIQAPIMVFREWHRHRTQSYNELSARYTTIPDFSYVPTTDRMLMGSDGKNKQAGTIKGAEVLTLESALEWQAELCDVYEHIEQVYQSGLRRGVPKELARLPIAVGRYSRMRASANLRNWLGFATLRSDKNPGAQWEIRQYGNDIVQQLSPIFPRTLELFKGA